MIRSRTEATQSNSTSKIIQVNNHCLIIIMKNSTTTVMWCWLCW